MEQYLFEDEIGKIHRYVNIHFRDETPVMDLLRKWEHAGGISIGILTSRIQRLIETERNRTEHGIGRILPVSLYRDEIRELTELVTQICRLIEVTIRDAESPKKLDGLMQEAALEQQPIKTFHQVLKCMFKRRRYLEQKIEGHPDKENIWA